MALPLHKATHSTRHKALFYKRYIDFKRTHIIYKKVLWFLKYLFQDLISQTILMSNLLQFNLHCCLIFVVHPKLVFNLLLFFISFQLFSRSFLTF